MTEVLDPTTQAPQPDDQDPQAEKSDKKKWSMKRRIVTGVAAAVVALGGAGVGKMLLDGGGDAGGPSKADTEAAIATIDASHPEAAAGIIAKLADAHVEVSDLQSSSNSDDGYDVSLHAKGHMNSEAVLEATAKVANAGGMATVRHSLVGLKLGSDGKPMPGADKLKFDEKSTNGVDIEEGTADSPGEVTEKATVNGMAIVPRELDYETSVRVSDGQGHDFTVTQDTPVGEDMIFKSGAGQGPSEFKFVDPGDPALKQEAYGQ